MPLKTVKLEISFQKLLDTIEQLTPDEKIIIEKKLIKEKAKKHSILELEGLGADLWKKINVERYIRKERKSWD
ncbi:MAG: hypothetical protein HY097_01160 [Nitrospinae bacterium]|nr:hypothetical protein [Nitrospinota bacterium]MBI3815320.1 hypothetical protein [Nitrospinota bacterium]